MLTFYRTDPFTLEAYYDGDVPIGNKFIGEVVESRSLRIPNAILNQDMFQGNTASKTWSLCRRASRQRWKWRLGSICTAFSSSRRPRWWSPCPRRKRSRWRLARGRQTRRSRPERRPRTVRPTNRSARLLAPADFHFPIMNFWLEIGVTDMFIFISRLETEIRWRRKKPKMRWDQEAFDRMFTESRDEMLESILWICLSAVSREGGQRNLPRFSWWVLGL